MEEPKIENGIRLCEVKWENVRTSMEKLKCVASDVLLFTLQWNDLEDYQKSVKSEFLERFRKLVSKEMELESRSFDVEERAKMVEAVEALVGDLEMKANGFRDEIEEKRKELDVLKNQGEFFLSESKAVEMRLTQLRKSVEECTVEERSKTSQFNEMVESLRKIQVKIDLKGEELIKMGSDLEWYRVEVSTEEERLCRTQTRRKELEEEIDRKTKDLSLVQDKTVECEKLLELQSSELAKTQDEIELKVKQLEQMSIDIERHRVEVSTEEEHLCRTQTRRRELEEEIDKKMKDLSLVRDQFAECEKLLELQSSELAKTQGEIELKVKQLEQMSIDLERHRREVSVEIERLDRSRTCERELREEIERKGIALTEVLDKIAECRKDQELVKEKLDSQQKLLDERSLELVCKEKKLEELRLDIDLMEHSVKSLNGEMEETCKKIEPKAKKLEDIERLIEERSAHYESIKLLIEEHNEEFASKEKKQNEMSEAIRKLSLQIASEEKTSERAKAFTERLSKKLHEKEKDLDSTRRHLEKCTGKYDSKKNELRSVKATLSECLQDLDIKERELKSLESRFTEINKQVEEGEKRLQHLDNSSEELIREIQVKQEELCSIKKTIMECSGESEVKRNDLDQVQSSITNLTAKLKSKECELDAVKKMIQDSLKDFQSKEEQQVRLEASLIKREKEFGLKEKELDAKDQLLKSMEQKLAKCVIEYEQKAKKLSSFCQQSNTDQQVVLVRDINACDEKHLQLLLRGHLKKCSELQLTIIGVLKSASDPAQLVLDTIQMMEQTNLDPVRKSSICLLECLINMSLKPNIEVLEQAIKLATEWKDTTLVKAVDPVDVLSFMHSLAAFCSAYAFDAEKVQDLFDVTFLRKYIPSLCEALGVSVVALVDNVLPMDDKPDEHPPEAPNSYGNDARSQAVHENVASSSHLGYEDTLKDLDGSASFSPNEVLTGLQYIKDPGSYVLSFVNDALMGARQRGEVGLGEPIVKTLIPFFEELPRVVRPSEHLKSEARQVAQNWSLMMGRTTAQMSPLEAWGFLQLIVAYGLVDSIKQNETLQFASNVAHFRKAPKLFQSLGLSFVIPHFVRQLINQRMFIPAIRFMFHFNLNSPLELLKQVIINLRCSARRTELQAEAIDAGKLRDIIELIEDFNLDIDLPVDLIVKFMVPREAPDQNHVQASPTVIPNSYISTTHDSNPSVPTIFGVQPDIAAQASESTSFQAQSSHRSGHKRPRVDPRVSSSVIRPCFNPSSSHGR